MVVLAECQRQVRTDFLNAVLRVEIDGPKRAAESQRDEYGFLTTQARIRSTILKPGAMFLLQPEIPIPVLVQFPFPAWATRADEAAAPEGTNGIPKGFLR